MEKKFVATRIIVAVIAVVVYFAVSSSNFLTSEISISGIANTNFIEASIFNQDAIKDAIPPELSINNITAKIVDGNTGNFSIIFNVFNPNKGTIMLESISYNVYSNSTRIVSGDIGDRPEGFVDSQDSIFPIIGNGTLILKDKRMLENNKNLNLSQFAGNDELSEFLVNGSYFFKQTGSFQSTGGEQTFNISYASPSTP